MAKRTPVRRANTAKRGDGGARQRDARAPMTTEQIAELKRLAQAGFEPDAYSTTLSFGQAAQRIAMLHAKLGKQGLPPHTL